LTIGKIKAFIPNRYSTYIPF